MAYLIEIDDLSKRIIYPPRGRGANGRKGSNRPALRKRRLRQSLSFSFIHGAAGHYHFMIVQADANADLMHLCRKRETTPYKPE